MTQSLIDRTAIVTGGAGRGMGRSIALTLAREGANVAVNYLNSADSAAAIAAHIEGQGGHAITVQADVTQSDQCNTLVDTTIDRLGPVDICIIGPGAGWHPEAVHELDSATALDDVQKELAPIYHLMPRVLPGMYDFVSVGMMSRLVRRSPQQKTLRETVPCLSRGMLGWVASGVGRPVSIAATPYPEKRTFIRDFLDN